MSLSRIAAAQLRHPSYCQKSKKIFCKKICLANKSKHFYFKTKVQISFQFILSLLLSNLHINNHKFTSYNISSALNCKIIIIIKKKHCNKIAISRYDINQNYSVTMVNYLW